MVATTATGTLPVRRARGEWPGIGGYNTLDVTRFFMVPRAEWTAVRTLRDLFPNGTGFYDRGANQDNHIELLGEQFRQAPADVTTPFYWSEMNERDRQDILSAVREGKLRSDFLTVALHTHHFRDARGRYRGPGLPEAEHLDTNPSIANYLEDFARASIDTAPICFRGPGYTWYGE